jgi:hypothetical protein
MAEGDCLRRVELCIAVESQGLNNQTPLKSIQTVILMP